MVGGMLLNMSLLRVLLARCWGRDGVCGEGGGG